MDFWGYGIDDYIPCEACGARAVDVHHIDARGMGGDPTAGKDVIENLVGLCREHHELAEAEPEANKLIKEIHLKRIQIHNEGNR